MRYLLKNMAIAVALMLMQLRASVAQQIADQGFDPRVAVFGEAAMFTAQLKGKDRIPFGLNSPDAPQNLQFLLNVVHWLDRKL